MRLIPQILALLLAITSIVVPCVAKTQIGDVAPTSSISAVSDVEIEKDTCHGTCIKAIVSRQDDNALSAIVVDSNDGLNIAVLHRDRFQLANSTAIYKPPNTVCTSSVDLHMLCRLLN